MSEDEGRRFERFGMRTDAAFLKELDDWRRKQNVIPSRSEAIHVLVRMAIKAEQAADGPAA